MLREGKPFSTTSQLMIWSSWVNDEYTHAVLCPVLSAILLGRYDVSNKKSSLKKCDVDQEY